MDDKTTEQAAAAERQPTQSEVNTWRSATAARLAAFLELQSSRIAADEGARPR